MTTQEQNYLIKHRAAADVEQHGSVQKAIASLKTELEEYEACWSN